MSIGSFVSGVASSAKNTATHAASSVAHKVEHEATGAAKSVAHRAESVGNGIAHDATGAANAVAHRANGVEQTVTHAASGALSTAKSDASLAGTVAMHTLDSLRQRTFGGPEVVTNPNVAASTKKNGLRMMTYNVELGGKNMPLVEKEIARARPDVVCLQEVSPENAKAAAEKLGYHCVVSATNQKAILSRFPVESASEKSYDIPFTDRIKSSFAAHNSEPSIDRSMLAATLKVGNKNVDVIDTHLSLTDPSMNARDLTQLAGDVKSREDQGHTVLVAGDFNANFALAGKSGVDRNGTPTDTTAEFKQRYPGAVVGNMGDSRVKAAANELLAVSRSHWSAQERGALVDGKLVTRAQAKRGLSQAPAGSPERLEDQEIVDGVSHLSAKKRFDNMFASPDATWKRAVIDRDVRASDHQPVWADVSFAR